MLARNAASNPLSSCAGRCRVKMTPRISRIASSISSTIVRHSLADVGPIGRCLQVQACGEQTLDHAVVEFAGDAVAVVENLEASLRLDELGRGLETLADVAHRGHGCRNLAQLAAERAERDLHGHLTTRTVQCRQQQPAAHRPSPRIVGVPLAM